MPVELHTQTPTPELLDLARTYGVIPEGGAVVPGLGEASASTLIEVLAALGVDASSPERIQLAQLNAEDERWRRMLPPIVVAREGAWVSFNVHVDDGDPVNVWVELDAESGGEHWALTQLDNFEPARSVDGRLVGRATFQVSGETPIGWHEIVATGPSGTARCPLLVAPNSVPMPPALQDCRQVWGLATQLYSVRSHLSWGLGDFADLADLAWLAGRKMGADFLLVNPVHAGEPMTPLSASPYLPTSRRFRHPLYIRPEDIPETAYLSSPERALVEWAAEPARALNTDAGPLNRDAVWEAKRSALEVIFTAPRKPSRQLAFTEFVTEQGADLETFATWCAIVEQRGSIKLPPELADPTSPAVSELAAELRERIEFYKWLQWVADEQAGNAHRTAREVGMAVGIVNDLAVGAHKNGADAWALGPVLASDVFIGSPPDFYNQQGQNWSQPPWHPLELARAGYAPFRAMIRAALRNSGALRVDHIIGMFRAWWIPEGCSPREGVYVGYDHEAMIGILVLEATRSGALVIGEDLGIVEPWVREYLTQRGILGSSVLWFEKDDVGEVLPPEQYRRLALAMVTTHDLPPTPGYLAGEHVEIRQRLGLLNEPVEWERQKARAERAEMLDMLTERGLISDDPSEREIVEALHRYLRSAPSLLLGVSLADAVGERRAQNQPGTDTEYPNWKVPLADAAERLVFIEDLPNNARMWSLIRALDAN